MKKQILSILVCLSMVLTLMPAITVAASAADTEIDISSSWYVTGETTYTVTESGTIDLTAQTGTDAGKLTLAVDSGYAVTIIGDSSTTYTNLSIQISGGASVTLDNVNIDNNSWSVSPVVAGDNNSSNTLYFEGDNTLIALDDSAGVSIGDGTALTVELSGAGTTATLTGGNWSEDKTVYTVSYSDLEYGDDYTVTISGFKNASEIAMADDNSHSFTTAYDAERPTVESVTPSGTGNAISGNIVIIFSEKMMLGTETVSLNNGVGEVTNGSWSDDNKVYTVPYSGLAYGTEYTITISGFSDTQENNMDADSSHRFTTKSESSSGGSGGSNSMTTYYTLTFETNGGSDIDSVKKNAGTTIDLNNYTTTRDGYTFAGWYSDSSLTSKVTSVTMSSSKTVYARWTSDTTIDLKTEDHMAYVYGYTDGTVRPDGNITRAETATMIYRLLTSERRDEIFTSGNAFSDVSADSWYNKAVSSMANGGYIYGYKGGTFEGDNAITRAEFVAILVRFIGVNDDLTTNFTDVSRDYWAYDYIATAVNAGWIKGYSDGAFKPNQYITRAEAMTMINRVLNRSVDENSSIPSGITVWPDNDNDAWYYYEVIEATNDHTYKGTRPSENWTSLSTDYTYDIAKYERP